MSDADKTPEELASELAAVHRELAALREVVDSIPHRVFWKDRKSLWLGGNRQMAQDCNLESPRDLVGRTDHDFFAKEHADFFQKCDREVMESGEALLEIEEPQQRPDGSMNYLLTSKVPFRDPSTNEVIGIIGTYIDITERKRLEHALHEALDAAKAAAEAKTNFLSVVSHELRTPLALILGPLESLRGHVPEALREEVDLVQRNAVRLKDLVDDVLDFSRLEAGKLAARPSVCDVARLVETLVDDAAHAATLRGLTLERDIDAISPFDMDGTLLQKIVLNLVGNAIKFTPAGGKIIVSLRALERGEVRITVSDTGPGISAEQQTKLFQRFEQADNTRTRTAEGTGLGLALVKEFAELLGGSVGVASAPGEGASFWVSLPVARTLTGASTSSNRVMPTARLGGAAATAVVERAGKSGISVVVAEDNPDMRRHIRAVLESTCRLTLCSNGQLALDEIVRERPDVVVSDVMMPVMDGLELTRRVRADERVRATPIVLLTARAGVEATTEGLDLGADDYVAKPFSAAELQARVRAAARAHALYRELEEHQRELVKANKAFQRATEELAAMEELAVVGQMTVDAQQAVRQKRGSPRVSGRLDALTRPRQTGR
jgi:PAS domain S-box-containing protein